MFLMINKCDCGGYRKRDASSLHARTQARLSAGYVCDDGVNQCFSAANVFIGANSFL